MAGAFAGSAASARRHRISPTSSLTPQTLAIALAGAGYTHGDRERAQEDIMHLHAVHDLVRRPGPFVTVQAEIGRTTEVARQQLDARWTTIRHTLEREGVGE